MLDAQLHRSFTQDVYHAGAASVCRHSQVHPQFTQELYLSVSAAWEDGKTPEIYAVCYGEFVSRTGFNWDNPPEDSWRLHWIEAGEGQISVNGGKPTPLRAGDIFVMSPGNSYQREDSKNNPWRYRWVMLRGSRVEESLKLAGIPSNKVHSRPEILGRMEPVFARMRQSFSTETPTIFSLCEFAYACLAACVDPTSGTNKRAESESTRAAMAVEWLRQHYTHGVTVEDAAKAVGLSRSGLFRMFRQYTGQNPKAYLDHLRTEHARHLMERGGYSAKEIAARSGFSDTRHMNQTLARKKAG